jgi:hypothetical protein
MLCEIIAHLKGYSESIPDISSLRSGWMGSSFSEKLISIRPYFENLSIEAVKKSTFDDPF